MERFKFSNHVMLDMETLSVADNPVVLSISAVAFKIDTINNLTDFTKPEQGHIRNETSFHCALEINDQIKRGLDFDSSTLVFHLEQNEKFFKECLGMEADGISIINPDYALGEFGNFLHDLSAKHAHYEQPIVWANGAVSDHKWLASLYKTYNLRMPIGFRDQLCFRTIREAYPQTISSYNNSHDSFYDCVNQIMALQRIYQYAT